MIDKIDFLDIAPLYLGVQIMCLADGYVFDPPILSYFEFLKAGTHKPILRRIEDMTYSEAICLDADFMDINHNENSVYPFSFRPYKHKFTVADFRYLLSNYFDLFGLIDTAQAIDEKTVTK